MITAQQIFPAIKRMADDQGKTVPTISDIEVALSATDQNALIASWRLRIEAKMWDGASNINAGTPEYIRETNPWLDVVYVLLIDGDLVFMQTHDPFEPGLVPITLETVDALSDKHANQIAEERANNDLLIAIATELNLHESI